MTNELYDLTNALAQIETTIEDAGGELTDDLEKALDAANMDFKSKVENIGKWICNLDGTEDMLDAEIKRLQARKKGHEHLKERLKEYVKMNMEKVGKTKIEYATMTVSIQSNPPSVDIVDALAIPARFYTVVPAYNVLDKKAVLTALKAGETIEGAVLIKDKTHLRVG